MRCPETCHQQGQGSWNQHTTHGAGDILTGVPWPCQGPSWSSCWARCQLAHTLPPPILQGPEEPVTPPPQPPPTCWPTDTPPPHVQIQVEGHAQCPPPGAHLWILAQAAPFLCPCLGLFRVAARPGGCCTRELGSWVWLLGAQVLVLGHVGVRHGPRAHQLPQCSLVCCWGATAVPPGGKCPPAVC